MGPMVGNDGQARQWTLHPTTNLPQMGKGPATLGLPEASLWARSWPTLLIVALTVTVYSNSFSGPFIFDDIYSIVENPSIRRLWPLWPILSPPPSCLTVVGRPFPNLTLAVNYAFGGLEMLVDYHAVNLIIHILAALTLYGVIRRTLSLPGMPASCRTTATSLALTVATLWTVHPLQTESVTYIVQRTESLMGLCYLFTLYCTIRGATADSRRAEQCWNVTAVLACLCGMASKEVMVSAPLIVGIYDWMFLYAGFREMWRHRRCLYAGLGVTWIPLAILVVQSAGRGNSAGFGYGMTSWEYLRTQFGWIVWYLVLAIWPHPLVLDYGNGTADSWDEIVPYLVLVGPLLIGTAYALGRRSWTGFLGAWFFAILAPTSSVVPLFGQTAAEHRMYLPLAAVCTLAAVGGWLFFQRLANTWPGFRRFAPALAATAVVALGGRTWFRNRDYRSELSIWETVVEARPNNSRAFLNRGTAWMNLGEPDQAVADLERALRLDPNYALAHQTLGAARRQRGELHEALEEYARVVALGQARATTYYHRGLVFRDLGQWDSAIADFSTALEMDPKLAGAYLNRGAAYGKQKQLRLAAADFSRAIELEPENLLYRLHRAQFHFDNGRFPEALSDLDIVIRSPVASAAAYELRGEVFEQTDQIEAAVSDFTRSLEIKPRLRDAFYGRARCFLRLENHARARADLDEFVRLGGTPDPDVAAALSAGSSRPP